MTKRLAEQLPPGAPELAAFDAAVTSAEHRRVLVKAASQTPYSKHTLRNYRYRFNHYQRWARDHGFQADPEFISDELAEAYVIHQATVDRYHPQTIRVSLGALRFYASRARVSPEPSFRAAFDVLLRYSVAVANAKPE